MKSYVIYKKNRGDDFTDTVFICDSFSWFFFLLSPIALLTNRLFKSFFVFVLLFLSITELINYSIISSNVLTFFYLTFSLYCGLLNDELIKAKLENIGYHCVDMVRASSLEEAKYRYLGNAVK